MGCVSKMPSNKSLNSLNHNQIMRWTLTVIAQYGLSYLWHRHSHPLSWNCAWCQSHWSVPAFSVVGTIVGPAAGAGSWHIDVDATKRMPSTVPNFCPASLYYSGYRKIGAVVPSLSPGVPGEDACTEVLQVSRPCSVFWSLRLGQAIPSHPPALFSK